MSGSLMVGVSGIRGIVGTDLTPEVVTRYAAAFGWWVRGGAPDRGRAARHAGPPALRPCVVVGRDSRASGPKFAAAAIAGLVSAGCDVIDAGLVPTPTVQLAVLHHRAGGGIVVTASHNPIEWNALKFVGPDGIFLDQQNGARVLEIADEPPVLRAARQAEARDGGQARSDEEAVARHLEAVLRLPVLAAERIRARRFHVALDTVRGAGGTIMPALLDGLGCRTTGIHLATDGRFPRAPEPVPENLEQLGALVRGAGADIGLAVDPDVDRLAIVDERGVPIGEDYTLAFAVRAVLGDGGRGGPGGGPTGRAAVVCNLSTSLVVEDAARDCGAEVVRTPVGEAHVARRMVELDAPIGGEGNGGVMYPAVHVGRDAPVAAALVLALLARTGKRVSELVEAAPRYVIVKAKVARGAGVFAIDKVGVVVERLRGAQVDTQDGLRLAWPDRWLHVRPSNTEPIIRLVAEAPTGADAEQLVDEGRRLCAAS